MTKKREEIPNIFQIKSHQTLVTILRYANYGEFKKINAPQLKELHKMNKPPLYYAAIPLAVGIIAQRELSVVIVLVIAIFVVLNRAKWLPIVAFAVIGYGLAMIWEHRNELPYDQPVDVVVRLETPPTIKGRWQRSTGKLLAYKSTNLPAKRYSNGVDKHYQDSQEALEESQNNTIVGIENPALKNNSTPKTSIENNAGWIATESTSSKSNARWIATEGTSSKGNASWIATDQLIKVYIDTSAVVGLGNTITFRTKHRSFDPKYASYYLNNGVTGSAYGYKVQVLESDTTIVERIKVWSSLLSDRISNIDTSPQNIALMQAITLGDKSELETEQRHQNVRAGTAHILAVSGLHVGIIFMALSLALGWIKLFRRGLIIFGITIIACLWAYAAITGFSPSVLRAVVMFTMYQTGVMISRDSNNLNTLLGAGLILLLCDPNYLFDIGFQLSFVAMFGIIAFYRPIYSLWPNRFWGLVSITLAAQIAAIPLSCYYFGNIPFFGIVSNLALWIVVPALIISTLVYLATGLDFVGSAAAWVASLYNDFVSLSSHQSWVAVEGIDMPQWLCLSIYAVMIAGIAVVGRSNSLKVGSYN